VSGDAQPQQPPAHDTAAGMPSAPLDVPVTVAPPVAATGPAPSVAAGPTQAPTAAPALPHQQVLTAVSPLLRGPDGGHQLQLQLRPHDLGTVNVTVDVSHGEVTIHLHAADDAARDLLRDHLPDLRHQLEEQGLRAGTLEVGTGGPDAQQWRARDGQTSPGGTRAPATGSGTAGQTDPADTAGVAQAAPGALDLRM